MQGVVENFFEDMECLEPKCPNCKTKLEYGTNTEYNEELQAHVCSNCGSVLQ
ncbi:MAG: hypothetical protein ACLFPQ_03885 [Candidatus Woesearchaeota archaeon]